MNILFLSLGEFDDLSEGSVHIDILKRFAEDHNVCLLCKNERRKGKPTTLTQEYGITVLRVKTGNLKNVGLIEKGISTILVEPQFISAIKKYFSDIKFDLVIYSTPPITFVSVVKFIKKRDSAKSYLMLKDIFPQNAVDLGMMSKSGIKRFIYKFFRNKEKKLYSVSDKIGCMSPANVKYILKNNPEIDMQKVEICPNSVKYIDKRSTEEKCISIRNKYNLPFDKRIFVYGGNLGKPQGIDFLIESLKAKQHDEDIYFLIIGNGTEYGKLESAIQENGMSNVLLMKALPKTDYDSLVSACDIGLIFLDYRFEIPNFPSRLLSYIQAGLPVLCCVDPNTDIGYIVEQNKFGWNCMSNDIDGFVSKINSIKAIQKVELQHLGENGRQFLLENYTVEKAYNVIMKG